MGTHEGPPKKSPTNSSFKGNKFPKCENLGAFGLILEVEICGVFFLCVNGLQFCSLIVLCPRLYRTHALCNILFHLFKKWFRHSYCKSLAHGVSRACFFFLGCSIFGLYILIVSSFIGWCWWSVLVVNPRKFTIIEQLMYWYSHRFLHTILNHRWFFSLEQWTKIGRLN